VSPASFGASSIQGRGAIPVGSARLRVDLDGAQIVVFTYRPLRCGNGPLLLVCHGRQRNAEEYRDHAQGLADRCGMLVAAPLFDHQWGGRRRYQAGGLLQGGRVAPREAWTWNVVPRLVARVRELEGRPGLPYFLLGHSAGAQFLLRLSAFVPTQARRLVLANPGSLLFPTRDMPYPYGFGNLPPSLVSDRMIRSYLARPITFVLGSEDSERDDDLDVSADADRQGKHRLERGRNAFRAASDLARRRGWDLGWRLVEAPGVGHDHEAVFDSPACRNALLDPASGR
jgi:pimeloyl-ACP methyl ester carboxylesterase